MIKRGSFMTIQEGKAYTRDNVFRRCILEYGANSQIDRREHG
nr:MAG TPA: hypothetical protein [Caudoviricetes sp.]